LNIFTDSPSQLDDCIVVNRAVTSPPTRVPPPDPVMVEPPKPEPLPVAPLPLDTGLDSTPGLADQQNQVTVPVKRAGRSLTVQARLNGTHSARLIVDTGADITILSHEVARDLGVTPTSSSPTVTLNTVGGSVRADVVRLGTIAVGSAEVRNVPVAVHTLPDAPPEVDGLLGLTFLDKFLVTLDAQKGELHLKKRE
jgi:clan AA aspartic protease (TIGR02281 family)